MAVTVAKRGGQGITPVLGAVQAYDLTLDTAFAAGGEDLDLTADFAEIDTAVIAGVADEIQGSLAVQIPASGVAVTASNVKLVASDGTAAITGDLSGANPVTILVTGKPNVEI
jgi:hypothetical protein